MRSKGLILDCYYTYIWYWSFYASFYVFLDKLLIRIFHLVLTPKKKEISRWCRNLVAEVKVIVMRTTFVREDPHCTCDLRLRFGFVTLSQDLLELFKCSLYTYKRHLGRENKWCLSSFLQCQSDQFKHNFLSAAANAYTCYWISLSISLTRH